MNNDLTEAWVRVQNAKEDVRTWWHKSLNKKNFIIILLIFIPVYIIYNLFIQAPSNFPSGSIITVESGQSALSIAKDFEEQNIIRSAFALRVAIEILEAEHVVLAGDYQFKRPLTLFSVARRLSTGAFGIEPIRVQIPEGTTVKGMSVILSEKLPRFSESDFLVVAEGLEGYLFPDTYFFLPNSDVNLVIRALIDNFEKNINDLSLELALSGRTLDQIIIMASILEKEGTNLKDKRLIAGVLWKRMEIGMALQVDAPFVYFLGKNTFELTLDDLQIESPFNTYRNKGLPPTAIANPGLESIRAAINPEKNDYLFYLADKGGTTHFSENYEEHLRKKRLYLGT
jgi:UPF0755 protein